MYDPRKLFDGVNEILNKSNKLCIVLLPENSDMDLARKLIECESSLTGLSRNDQDFHPLGRPRVFMYPEAYIHPKAQFNKAIEISEFVNKGNRALVVTQSDFLVTTLNILYDFEREVNVEGRLELLEIAEKEGISRGAFLTKDSVSVWLLNYSGDVITFKNVDFDNNDILINFNSVNKVCDTISIVTDEIIYGGD